MREYFFRVVKFSGEPEVTYGPFGPTSSLSKAFFSMMLEGPWSSASVFYKEDINGGIRQDPEGEVHPYQVQ